MTNLKISNENINDLMTAALEDGINYWCSKVEMKKDKIGGYEGVSLEDEETLEFASEIIGIGGTLVLHDAESSDKWELNKEKFLKGLEKTMVWGNYESIEELMDNHDTETADVLIQFAVFNEIIFG